MQIYGFSYDGGEFCYLSRDAYARGVATEREEQGGELPGFTPWNSEVPDEILLDERQMA